MIERIVNTVARFMLERCSDVFYLNVCINQKILCLLRFVNVILHLRLYFFLGVCFWTTYIV